MKTMVIFLTLALGLQGCVVMPGHQEFYNQAAPSKYAPTESVTIFEYSNVDLKDIYDLLFSDFLVIGRSAFNGPYEEPGRSASFAKSIGADVFLSTAQFKETRTSFMNMTTPTTTTTRVSGYSGSGSFYGTATSYGTTTTSVPVRVNRYDQDGLFLKNVNGVLPLWQRTQAQYQKTEASDLEGTWTNEGYKLSLYRSGQQLVAFIASQPLDRDKKSWRPGDLKFIFGADTGVGVYLMANKTPVPARFAVNKFGHLEVDLIAAEESFSFARL